MQSITLRLWSEEITLEDAFLQLLEAGVEHGVLKELGKRLLYLRNFEDLQLAIADEEARNAILQDFYTKMKLDNADKQAAWLKKNQITEEMLSQQLVFQEQVNRLKQAVITNDMVKEQFLKRKPKMDAVVFALIRVDSEALAKELYYKVTDDNEDFGKLAREFSVGPEAPFNGIVGPKIIQELNPELRSVLLSLKPGEVAKPFTLDGSQYMLVRLLRVDSAQLNPPLEQSLQEELFEQWTDRQLNLAQMQLLNKSKLKGRSKKAAEARS